MTAKELMVASVLASAFALGCNGFPNALPDEQLVPGFVVDPAMRNRPECPDSLGFDLTLSGPITNIPEFHDCQRFIVRRTGSTWSYGVMYAIWVRDRLDSAVFPLPSVSGIGIGISRTQTDSLKSADSLSRLPSGPQTSLNIKPVGVPVAVVYSYGARYHPLSIEAGYNCLYLYHGTPDPTQWQAKMVPVAHESDCDKTVNPDSVHGGQLQVKATSEPPFGDPDYPGVGRWDRDTTKGHEYAGLRCGPAWCEIGETGFQSSKGHPSTASLAKQRRVVRIKGWYDEQPLATGTSSALQPNLLLMGTIYPDADLDTRHISDFSKMWIPAANVELSANSDQYKVKLNFEHGTTAGSSNVISLCYGAKADCIPDVWRSKLPCGDAGQQTYWAMIVAAQTKDTVYKCVTFRSHMGVAMRGTARWRWTNGDETNWIRCPDGCCQVHP
jgi:hypothetical protein